MLVWQADLKGVNAAKNYWQAYFDKYTYEHEVLAGAADKEDVVAFSFWLDKVTTSVTSSLCVILQACDLKLPLLAVSELQLQHIGISVFAVVTALLLKAWIVLQSPHAQHMLLVDLQQRYKCSLKSLLRIQLVISC